MESGCTTSLGPTRGVEVGRGNAIDRRCKRKIGAEDLDHVTMAKPLSRDRDKEACRLDETGESRHIIESKRINEKGAGICLRQEGASLLVMKKVHHQLQKIGERRKNIQNQERIFLLWIAEQSFYLKRTERIVELYRHKGCHRQGKRSRNLNHQEEEFLIGNGAITRWRVPTLLLNQTTLNKDNRFLHAKDLLLQSSV